MTVWTWETRQSWGAVPPRVRRTDVTPQGVAIHWPGPGQFVGKPHSNCQAVLRSWQKFHIARGSNDLEYGLVLCPHLRLMEARIEQDKPTVRVGSNGTASANQQFSSVQLMRALDDPPPTDEEILGLAEAVVWLRKNGGWGPSITGHRDHVSTTCPGTALYSRLGEIRRLVDRLEATGDSGRDDDRMPIVELSRVQKLATQAKWARGYGKKGRAQVKLITDALKAEKVSNYRQWQKKLGYSGANADGVPGKSTLTKLGRRHGFQVVP